MKILDFKIAVTLITGEVIHSNEQTILSDVNAGKLTTLEAEGFIVSLENEIIRCTSSVKSTKSTKTLTHNSTKPFQLTKENKSIVFIPMHRIDYIEVVSTGDICY